MNAPTDQERYAPEPDHRVTARPHLDWLRLFLEFVIVVAGITLSFWVQDLREQRAKRAEEVRYLNGFRRDLRTDLGMLARRAEALGGFVDAMALTVDAEKRPALSVDDLDRAMDSALSYIGFQPSQATYSELRQSGGSRLIRDKELLGELIQLYEQHYTQAEEWDSINRNFVMQRMFPYIEDFGPRATSELNGVTLSGYHVIFAALENETRFQNLLRSNTTFKEAQVFVYESLTKKVQRVVDLLGPGAPQ